MLAIFLICLLIPWAVRADGPVMDARAGPGWGPQVDAAALSPAPFAGLPGSIERVQFWPWPPVQGQTVAVWVQAVNAMTVTLSLDGFETVVYLGEDGRGEMLVPIGALAEPGGIPLLMRANEQTARLPLFIQAGTFPTFHISQETGGGILNDGEKVRAETAAMTQLFAQESASGWMSRARFRLPFDGALVQTAPFGQRRTYGDNPTTTAHAGQDFSAAPGTPVYAPATGVVVLAESLFVRGNAVVLDHGSGVYTGYWHLSESAVTNGQRVDPGALIGKVGSTGLSTGAHLHWEMRVHGMAVDPLQWVTRPDGP